MLKPHTSARAMARGRGSRSMLFKDDLLRAVEPPQGACVVLPLELCSVATAAAQICHNLGYSGKDSL